MTVEVGHAQRERTTSRSPNSRPFRELAAAQPDGGFAGLHCDTDVGPAIDFFAVKTVYAVDGAVKLP